MKIDRMQFWTLANVFASIGVWCRLPEDPIASMQVWRLVDSGLVRIDRDTAELTVSPAGREAMIEYINSKAEG